MLGKLLLARHHESEWNKLGLWTGKVDKHLTEYGFEKAGEMGALIQDIPVDEAFTSTRVRTIETLTCMFNTCEWHSVPTIHSPALDERDYGDYTGKNKWDMKELLGEEEFNKLRRSWDYPIPNGESLKMVYERVIPFFTESVLPKILEGKNILIVAHGNSLRALLKYLEDITDDKMAEVEFPFGAVMIYDIDVNGKKVDKQLRIIESKVNA
ncbi:MAG: 2,3-bisphosphoglycerate-dependent phosphoglycerate mutase [Candidatus Pacebacteria bacterium]|nr:2,3-bisphosphoglycerate-dependent phosphoglycerate mutase [Candidatus Paceibacterota bacterium]MCF7862704.1 2,3-bisphosphoglycerate-dependent phosphoglycerate mutase [Candidatus Paceibacterota bacterium]